MFKIIRYKMRKEATLFFLISYELLFRNIVCVWHINMQEVLFPKTQVGTVARCVLFCGFNS